MNRRPASCRHTRVDVAAAINARPEARIALDGDAKRRGRCLVETQGSNDQFTCRATSAPDAPLFSGGIGTARLIIECATGVPSKRHWTGASRAL